MTDPQDGLDGNNGQAESADAASPVQQPPKKAAPRKAAAKAVKKAPAKKAAAKAPVKKAPAAPAPALVAARPPAEPPARPRFPEPPVVQPIPESGRSVVPIAVGVVLAALVALLLHRLWHRSAD